MGENETYTQVGNALGTLWTCVARALSSGRGSGQSRESSPPTSTCTANSGTRRATDTQEKASTRHRSDSLSREEREIRRECCSPRSYEYTQTVFAVVQGKLADAQKRLNAAQTAMQIYNGIDWETATSRFSTVLRYLEKERKEMSALPELRKQVRRRPLPMLFSLAQYAVFRLCSC